MAKLCAIWLVCLASCGGGPSSGELQVAALCQSDESSQGLIHVAFRVIDTSDHAIDLGDVTVRYYFSHMIATGADPVMMVEAIERGALTDVYAAFTDAHVDIKYVPTAVQLAPSDPVGSGLMQVRLHASDFSNWDVSVADDYSYVACVPGMPAMGFVPRPTMTGYVDGTLAWGVEP